MKYIPLALLTISLTTASLSGDTWQECTQCSKKAAEATAHDDSICYNPYCNCTDCKASCGDNCQCSDNNIPYAENGILSAKDDDMDDYDYYLSSYGVARTRRLKVSSALSFFAAIFTQLSNLVVALHTKNKEEQKIAAINITGAVFAVASELSQKEAMKERDDEEVPESVQVIEATRSLLHNLNATSLSKRTIDEYKETQGGQQKRLTITPNNQEERFKEETLIFIKKLIAIFEKQIAAAEPQYLQPIHAILQDLMAMHFDYQLPGLAEEKEQKEMQEAVEAREQQGMRLSGLRITNKSGSTIKMAVSGDEQKVAISA
jgi:hypothetical protein